jgi:hypothetical protein
VRGNCERLNALTFALLREESLDEEQIRTVTSLPKRPAAEIAIVVSRYVRCGAAPAVPLP